ncbi:MAG: GNAT family N-acetyltransferase [Lachnospiraceae bacterium]|nr:GNAT family N-acetyltransferase [Lachnospiraceae bacterium]MBD5496586.1 GNAT family N-acetyltransferase [Lachnospiraceae bacterium]
MFVRESYRNRGYAKELLNKCEAWAKDKGCKEFASDCELDNDNSFRFHKAMNFTEANRIICFTKKL